MIPRLFFKLRGMKNQSHIFIALTTVILLAVTILSAINFDFAWIFFLVCFGQAFLIFTVYKVLTDDYTTEKTFEDGYEDYLIKK